MSLDVLSDNSEDLPFGEYEEEAIASLIVDHPEFFHTVAKYLKPELFSRPAVQYVVAHILNYFEEYSVFPSRGMLLDGIKKELTVDDEGFQDIIDIANRKSDPREVPAIKDRVVNWARAKAYGLVYSPDAMAKYADGDFESIEEIFEQARNIQDIGLNGMWFFEDFEKMFIEEDVEHFTTGFKRLDRALNDGGPSRKEMLIWMAPTGVGKSIVLCNNAISSIKEGRNVLYLTLELSDLKSALRMMGALTGHNINKRFDTKNEIMAIASRLKRSGDIGDLYIQEFPPDEISVDHIYALIDQLKRLHGWVPDVVIVDYLELMRGRRESDNRDDYARQKAVATQLRGVSQQENVFMISATQTNRSGNEAQTIDVTKMAESYGKAMPMDYLVSINQSQDEYDMQFGEDNRPIGPAGGRMFIAKNRNGPKFLTIPVRIYAATNMRVKEVE